MRSQTIEIQVPDMNDSVSRIVLCGKQFYIRFTYNDTCGYWTFGLSDSLQRTIRAGIKIVPQFPLNLFCGSEDMPLGVFGALSDLEKIGRNDFKDGKATFIFAWQE